MTASEKQFILVSTSIMKAFALLKHHLRLLTLLQTVETRQLEEALSCIFHTVLLHRTSGKVRGLQSAISSSIFSLKLSHLYGNINLWCRFSVLQFHFTSEHTYSVGTLGYLDVPCETINFTFVKLASPELDKNISKQIRQFCDTILESANEGSASGEVRHISFQYYIPW